MLGRALFSDCLSNEFMNIINKKYDLGFSRKNDQAISKRVQEGY